MGQSLSLVFPFCGRQVFLPGSILSPSSDRFSYCVHSEAETVRLSPHTRVGSPGRLGPMPPCAPFQYRAGPPYKTC